MDLAIVGPLSPFPLAADNLSCNSRKLGANKS